MYINFNDDTLKESLDIMLAGLLPYKEEYIKKVESNLVDDLENLQKIQIVKDNKLELDFMAYTNKLKEINSRLHLDDIYKDYLNVDDEEILNIDISMKSRDIIETIIKDKKENMDKLFVKITSYIKPDEFDVEYFVFITILNEIYKVNSHNRTSRISERIAINRSLFDKTISNIMTSLISKERKKMNIEEYLRKDGLDTNLEIEQSFDEACTYLYNRCINLYDKLDSMNISISRAFAEELTLKSVLKINMISSSIEAQTLILGNKLYSNGRMLSGEEDCLFYMKTFLTEIESRFSLIDDSNIISTRNLALLREEERNCSPERISDFGIKEVDDCLEIMTKKMYTIVAQEGTGKTNTACHIASRIINNGNKVLYICTETSKIEILNRVVSSLIKLKYGVDIPYNKLSFREELPEDLQKVIRLIEAELQEEDFLVLQERVSYEEFSRSCENIIKEYGVKAIIVDHSALLSRENESRDLRQYISKLSEDCIQLQKQYQVATIITSHPSSDASNDMARFGRIQKETSVTRDSSDLSRASDFIMFLATNQDLEERGLISAQITKLRGPVVKNDMIYLRKKFSISSIEYHLEDQSIDVSAGNVSDVLHQLKNNIKSM